MRINKCSLPEEIRKKYELQSLNGYLCIDGVSIIFGKNKDGKFRRIIEDKKRDKILLF